MDRCEYCKYITSVECESAKDRVSNDFVCDDFRLNYDTLSDKEKKAIQKRLMKGGNVE